MCVCVKHDIWAKKEDIAAGANGGTGISARPLLLFVAVVLWWKTDTARGIQ